MRGELSALRAEAEAHVTGQKQAAARTEGEVKGLAEEVRARKGAGGAVEAAPASQTDVANTRAAAQAEGERARAADQTAAARERTAAAERGAGLYPTRQQFEAYGVRQPLGPAPGIGQLYPSQAELQAYAARTAPPPPPMPISAAGIPGGSARDAFVAAQRAGGRIADEATVANAGLSRSLREISSGYGQVAYQSRVYGDEIHRHGALTTEFIQALARGEVTLREFGNELVLTGGKFAGWTLAATAIYGAARAFGELARGAIDAQSATRGLERFIPNLNQGQATENILNVSRQLNVPVQDVGQAQQLFARIFPDETASITAARTALLAYKLDQISVADSTRFLTAVTQEFQLPASRLPSLFDQISAAQRRMGARVAETLPGLARSSAAVKNAGGDLSQLVALIATAQVASGQTGATVGTAFTRSASNFIRLPASQATLQGFGINTEQGYTKVLIDAVRRAQTLSGQDRIALARAIGGPQYGARIFQSLVNNDPRLERALGVTSQAASRGSAAEELDKVLGQADEKLKQIGNTLQRIGAELANGGFATGAGLLLTTFDHVLGDVDKLLSVFSQLPSPLKQTLATAAELGVTMRVLGRFGFGAGFAGVPVLGRAFNATSTERTQAQAALSGLKELRGEAAANLERATALAVVEMEKFNQLQRQGSAVEAEELAAQEARASTAVTSVEAARTELALQEAIVLAQEKRLAALATNVPWGGRTTAAAAEGAAVAEGAAAGAAGAKAAATGSAAVAAEAEVGVAAAQTRLAATGAALTALGGSLRAFLFNPLTLLLIGMEAVPAELRYRQQQTQQYNDSLAGLGSDTSAQGTLQARQRYLDQHKPGGTGPLDVAGVALSGITHGDINPFDWENDVRKREQEQSAYKRAQQDLATRLRTQDEDFARGVATPYLTLNQIGGKLKTAIESYRSGRSSAAQLQSDYGVAVREINTSAEATAGGAKNARAVAAALESAHTAILSAAQGHKAVADALKGASLDSIATALQSDAEVIAQFGVTPRRLDDAAQKYAAAAAAYAKNPGGGTKPGDNLKAMKAAQSALDSILGQVQSDLQQALSLSTTQGGRDAAYSTYESTIRAQLAQTHGGVSRQRDQLRAARTNVDQARRARDRLQREYDDATKALAKEQDAFQPKNNVPGLTPEFRPSDPTRQQSLDQLKARVDELKKKLDDAHGAVTHATEAARVRERKLEVLLRDAERQQAQEDNSIRDLRSQIRAGRESSAAAGLMDTLKAAQADLANDVRHHVGEQQQLQDELRIQQAQDQLLQAQVQEVASKGALSTSRIDPTNTAAVDQSNLRSLREQLSTLRRGHPSPERTKQIRDLETQINQLQFQAAANARQQAQDLINARFGLSESRTSDPIRIAALEVQKDRHLLTLAHTNVERLNAQSQLNKDVRAGYDAYVQSQLAEIDFRAHVGKITTDQEVKALERLLRYAHLSRDARRNILTQIYDLTHQNQSDVELNVGNIRLPTLYDIRRLAAAGTSNPVHVTQTIAMEVSGAGDPQTVANTIYSTIEKHHRTALKGAQRAAGVR